MQSVNLAVSENFWIMRILYLTGQIKYYGGIEKVLTLKLNYLSEQLCQDVFLLTYEQGNSPFVYPVSPTVTWEDLGLDYDFAVNKKGMFACRNLLKGIKHFFLLRRKIRKIHPDVIVIPNGGGYDYFFLPFIFRKIPKVREIHSSLYRRGDDNKGFKMRLRESIEHFFESKYSTVVSLNEDERKFVNNSKVAVIPNPVINDVCNHMPNLSNNLFITAGRLCPVKGYDTLIDVWKLVHESYPDLKLHIFGAGDESYVSYLQKKIADVGLSDVIILKGAVNDLNHRMLDYSAFICSSHTECFPMVILEAMTVGLPVISFDCPFGPRNIIQHGVDGFLTPNQNIELLAQSIIDYAGLSLAKKKSLSDNARSNVQRFNIDVVMNQWLNLFVSLSRK